MAVHMGFAPAAGAALLALFCGACAPECTTDADEVGTCKVEYRTCRNWVGTWMSTATDASDPSSDLSAASGQCGTRDEAEAQATVALFQELDGCNCEEQSIPYGRCILVARGCYVFESTEAFRQMVPAFWMRITDQGTGLFGTAGLYSQPQDAFNPALADLGTKMDLNACVN